MKLNLIFMFIIPGCILPAYAQSPVGIPGKPSIENIQFDIVYDYDHKYPQPKYSLFSFDNDSVKFEVVQPCLSR